MTPDDRARRAEGAQQEPDADESTRPITLVKVVLAGALIAVVLGVVM